MTAFDHALTLTLAVILPAYAAWDVPRLAQRVAADPVNARTRDYIWSIAIQWGLTLALIAAWWWAARPIRHLGLRLPDSPGAWWWTLAIGGVGIALFAQQAYSIATSPDAQAKVRKQLESQPGVQTILPATPREARAFCAVAITAGICEEVLYRGYLLWYLLSLWPGRLAHRHRGRHPALRRRPCVPGRPRHRPHGNRRRHRHGGVSADGIAPRADAASRHARSRQRPHLLSRPSSLTPSG